MGDGKEARAIAGGDGVLEKSEAQHTCGHGYPEGTVITEECWSSRDPVYGIRPKFIDLLVGRKGFQEHRGRLVDNMGHGLEYFSTGITYKNIFSI